MRKIVLGMVIAFAAAMALTSAVLPGGVDAASRQTFELRVHRWAPLCSGHILGQKFGGFFSAEKWKRVLSHHPVRGEVQRLLRRYPGQTWGSPGNG